MINTTAQKSEQSGRIDVSAIKSRVSILEIVQGYVDLKKRGRFYQALCPFHNEDTPSFTVYPETGRFHCFGCGEGGDVIDFVGKVENLSFHETIKRLSNESSNIPRTAIAKPAPMPRPARPEIKPEMIELYTSAYEMARHTLLVEMNREAEEVRGYLGTRGFRKEDLAQTTFGAYVPAVREYVAKNYSNELVKKSGLVKYGMGYNYQVVMPHYNEQGKIAGLTFRLVKDGEDKEGKPLKKYQHTPDLDKSFLYNLHHAIPYIRKTGYTVIVEGHLDVQALRLTGYPYAVCLGGNRLNKDQIEYLIKYGAKIFILWLDSDDRGMAGCSLAVQALLVDPRVSVFVVNGEKYKDVGKINELVNERADIVRQHISSAVSGPVWLGKHLSITENDQEKQNALIEAKEIYLNVLKDPIQRQDFLKNLARGLGYKIADVEHRFLGKAVEPAGEKTVKPVNHSRKTDGVLVLAQNIDRVIKSSPDLYSIQVFLKKYYIENKGKLKPDVRAAIALMNEMCKNYQLSQLKEFVADKLNGK